MLKLKEKKFLFRFLYTKIVLSQSDKIYWIDICTQKNSSEC
jgi:hypothetical protein